MKELKTVLKGQKYVSPRAESVEVVNQGVLCASVELGFKLEVEEDFLI